MATGSRLLKFHCTGCGNCCRDPLLPITDSDLQRLVDYTSLPAKHLVKWIDRRGIDLPGEPESFAVLRCGSRVMVLRHQQGRCRFLGDNNHCNVYDVRPLGCRIFPFDPDFNRHGKLLRLRLIEATQCPYDTDGLTNIRNLYRVHRRTEDELNRYQTKVVEWNKRQKSRARRGHAAATTTEYLDYLGFE